MFASAMAELLVLGATYAVVGGVFGGVCTLVIALLLGRLLPRSRLLVARLISSSPAPIACLALALNAYRVMLTSRNDLAPLGVFGGLMMAPAAAAVGWLVARLLLPRRSSPIPRP